MGNFPLQLKGVRKTFRDGDKEIEILHSLSFQAKKGELVAVLGPSGSGKSTFLSIAGALLSPDEGELMVNGKNIALFKDKQKADIRLHSIGYIFQSSNLIPYVNVKDQLKLVADLTGTWNKESKKRAYDLIHAVGLENREGHYPHQLSGGEKQRVAIARAFMNQPEIILADEPTASLDSKRSKEIVELIAREVKEKNKAAIMVTHDESILSFCDQIYYMKDGNLQNNN
ncbi:MULTISPECIES: ABC transporter ATP-binding protein [Bacillus]|uniref:ABC transporter ATP-binding protein n=1 Tax=Bacillus TaxID=1386 RepID=UPI00158348D9|nr:ABC transporter ATP-binding protein [Bacillus glycinifermentans]MBU8787783.1 ATP-binding cassette domain-containing protein [Bacillus glycinifermentans]NUJ17642.1 ABC transporter ATP-binding protein [Bacillus glycinifermentans]